MARWVAVTRQWPEALFATPARTTDALLDVRALCRAAHFALEQFLPARVALQVDLLESQGVLARDAHAGTHRSEPGEVARAVDGDHHLRRRIGDPVVRAHAGA